MLLRSVPRQASGIIPFSITSFPSPPFAVPDFSLSQSPLPSQRATATDFSVRFTLLVFCLYHTWKSCPVYVQFITIYLRKENKNFNRDGTAVMFFFFVSVIDFRFFSIIQFSGGTSGLPSRSPQSQCERRGTEVSPQNSHIHAGYSRSHLQP